MSSDINTVNISGRLGAEPIVKYFETGSVSSEISIAVNKYDVKKGEEKTTWHIARAWGKKAEYIGEYAKPGDKVFISGSIEKDVYVDKEGIKRAVAWILIDRINIISKKDEKN